MPTGHGRGIVCSLLRGQSSKSFVQELLFAQPRKGNVKKAALQRQLQEGSVVKVPT